MSILLEIINLHYLLDKLIVLICSDYIYCKKGLNIIPILFHSLSPPLELSRQTFLFHRLLHIILYHKLMHRLYIHHPIFELIFQQERIKLRFHFHLNFLFDNKDTVLAEIIINFRILAQPWAGKNKSDISSLFPGDALRMRNR